MAITPSELKSKIRTHAIRLTRGYLGGLYVNDLAETSSAEKRENQRGNGGGLNSLGEG
jgi:hypothetical protein